MATETKLREGTGSRFMEPGTTLTLLFPTNGQGGTSATASASECVNASKRNPAVIDAIILETVATAAVTVNIRASDGTTGIAAFAFPISTTRQVLSLAPFGLQIDQNWCTVVTTTTGTITGLKVLYRYGAS